MPCDDGYLSLRFRPQGKIFRQIKTLYAKLVQREEVKTFAPEASATVMMEELEALGFASYQAFMVEVLREEQQLRFKNSEREIPKHQATMESLVADVQRVQSITRKMSVGFRNIRGEPINMRILASRIEGSGAAVSSISQNYEVMAGEMWEELNRMAGADTDKSNGMHEAFLNGQFSLLLTEVMTEAVEHFEETKIAEVDSTKFEVEQRQIAAILNTSMRNATTRIQVMIENCQTMPDMCRRLRRRVNGLDVVKLFCRVESGRLTGSDSGLEGIIERLNKFHSEVDTQLAELSTCARTIVTSGRRLHEQVSDHSIQGAA